MKITLAILISFVFLSSFGNYKDQNSAVAADDSTKVCIVSGEALTDEKVSFDYLDKTYEFCCNLCIKSFKKEPMKYISADAFDPVCEMHDAKKEIFFIHDKVKYYFCNENCKASFEASPDQYLERYKKDNKK
ncbi:MAG: hypothetical protein HGGPFJEG_02794 [Ignavibacteria bacterium]|nr:hypothetical protein [Ignavibacteria bacterium]